MLKIRLFEEQVNQLYLSAKMPGLAHLYIGEEAVAVGVCEALRRDDYITSTHRGHGHCLAKGASLDRMFAELLGKEAGYCRGKGGSMHIADQDTGNLGANAIVGGSAGIATGAAMSIKMRGTRSGGGLLLRRGRAGARAALRSDEHGVALEAAGDLRLREQPVQRVHPLLAKPPPATLTGRAEAFGIHVETIDGQDVRAVHATAHKLVERARRGEGPAFLHCNTYRFHGHHVGDIDRAYYRSKEEEAEWKTKRDPVKLLARMADEERNWRMSKLFERIENEVATEIKDAVNFALNAPYPGRRTRWISMSTPKHH